MRFSCFCFSPSRSDESADDPSSPHEYTYYPLDASGNGELRLIRLWPGPVESEDIKLEIFHARKSSKPAYQALSYTWGSSIHTDVALVYEAADRRGKRKARRHLLQPWDESITTPRLGIAHNLAVALRHLRYPDRERTLWVDAICINQTDDEEKSREVLLMGSIYSNAKQVVVWLGSSEDNSTLALKTLDQIGQEVEYDRGAHRVTSRPGTWAKTLTFNEQALEAEISSWVAIGKLLRRGWFSRLCKQTKLFSLDFEL